MRTHTQSQDGHSAQSLLKELAVEGTSSLVEAQRTLLNLAQQENEIILKGVKERIGGFVPAVAVTDLVRHTLDTFIGMQQEMLTTTSKHALQFVEPDKSPKGGRGAQFVEFAREGVETFARAQKKFLEVAQEAARAARGKHEHELKAAKKTELMHLAREAATAFVEAQKRLLDVMGQQMNVNLDVATRALQMIPPSGLFPMANLTGESVRNFVERETNLIGSLIKPKKAVARTKHPRRSAPRPHKTVTA